jgi:hypothetical protein
MYAVQIRNSIIGIVIFAASLKLLAEKENLKVYAFISVFKSNWFQIYFTVFWDHPLLNFESFVDSSFGLIGTEKYMMSLQRANRKFVVYGKKKIKYYQYGFCSCWIGI